MTFISIEDAPADQEEIAQSPRTIPCSWCGQIIHLNGEELALAICQNCYTRMLADFVDQQRMRQAPVNSSDR